MCVIVYTPSYQHRKKALSFVITNPLDCGICFPPSHSRFHHHQGAEVGTGFLKQLEKPCLPSGTPAEWLHLAGDCAAFSP